MRPRRHLKFLLWGQEVIIQRLAAGAPLLSSLIQLDAECLFDGLEVMAGVWSRFHLETPEDMVSKAVVFESAHLPTDHLAKYSKLHCGRYVWHVKARSQINPISGRVLDYTYRKRMGSVLVVARFDYHTLNYAGPQLAWRSTLCGSRLSISCPDWRSLACTKRPSPGAGIADRTWKLAAPGQPFPIGTIY